MAQYGGFPPVISCDAPEALDLTPTEDQSPPVVTNGSGGNKVQPESCNLSCSKGNCHSHNVFGNCIHDLTWSIEPFFGDAAVSNVVIFKGDSITFNSKGDQLAHNVYEITNAEMLETCDFSNSMEVANVEVRRKRERIVNLFCPY